MPSTNSKYWPTDITITKKLRDYNADALSGKILRLTLNKWWFEMILCGQKKQEYREIKPYWSTRLTYNTFHPYLKPNLDELPKYVVDKLEGRNILIKHFDRVIFTNGYGDDKPSMVVELNKISITTGNPDWGADEGEYYYVLDLGDVLYTKNIKGNTKKG